MLALLSLVNVVLITGITFSSQTSTQQVLAGAFLLVNFLLTIFEVAQLYSSGVSYFYLLKNYLDMFRLILGYLWVYFSISSDFDNLDSANALTLVTSLFFWLEGVNAFKVLDSTRYYIWLIQEVAKDIRGFLGILVYFVLAYCAMLGTTNEVNFWESFKVSYNLLLGNLESSELDELQWTLFILGSVLNLIVMLNLLISIISESFDRITYEKKESDTRIRLGEILEV